MATKLQEKLRCEREGIEFIDTTLSTVGRTKVEQHYVKNADLLEELIACKNNNGVCSDKLAKMFLQISTKLSNKLIFPSPEDKEDAIATAVLDCVQYFTSFDETQYSNAFSYITSIAKNGFAKSYRKLSFHKLPQSQRVRLTESLYSI